MLFVKTVMMIIFFNYFCYIWVLASWAWVKFLVRWTLWPWTLCYFPSWAESGLGFKRAHSNGSSCYLGTSKGPFSMCSMVYQDQCLKLLLFFLPFTLFLGPNWLCSLSSPSNPITAILLIFWSSKPFTVWAPTYAMLLIFIFFINQTVHSMGPTFDC